MYCKVVVTVGNTSLILFTIEHAGNAAAAAITTTSTPPVITTSGLGVTVCICRQNITDAEFTAFRYHTDVSSQRGLVVRAKYFCISYARGNRFRTAVSKAWATFGREDCMFRPTRIRKFSPFWVMVSPGCSEKNTVPPVTREVTEDPYVNWCPPCMSFVRFVPCCHCLCIRSFVPCYWNAGLLRLVRLKEYGRGTQSLGLNCPLSEVGTPPPHNSGMAYGLETENNNIWMFSASILSSTWDNRDHRIKSIALNTVK